VKLIKKVYQFIFLVTLLSCNSIHDLKDVDLASTLESLSIRQIDTMKFGPVSAASYSQATDYAMQLLKDSSNPDRMSKGSIILAVMSRHISEDITNKNLDPGSSAMRTLLKKYEDISYFIYQPKIPDFLKVMNRACTGDYAYIMGRLKQRWYYYPSLVMIAAFLLFSFANLLGVSNWKHRRLYNVIFCSLIFLIVTACILFKKTCDKHVTEDSFYGIHF
jgi:hypothetical protein